MIWDELPQEAIGKSVVSFPNRLRSCVNAKGGQLKRSIIVNLVINICVLTINNWRFLHFERVKCSKYAGAVEKPSFIFKSVLFLNNEN